MKNLQLLLFCLIANILFGQIKFDHEKLTLVQNVYNNNSTKQNISTFMENKGYTASGVEKGEGSDGDLYIFDSEFNSLEIRYTPKGTIDNVTMIYDGTPNNIFIEMKLKDAGFTAKEHEMEIEGKMIKKNQWTKQGQKISIITAKAEEQKMGILGYSHFED